MVQVDIKWCFPEMVQVAIKWCFPEKLKKKNGTAPETGNQVNKQRNGFVLISKCKFYPTYKNLGTF